MLVKPDAPPATKSNDPDVLQCLADGLSRVETLLVECFQRMSLIEGAVGGDRQVGVLNSTFKPEESAKYRK